MQHPQGQWTVESDVTLFESAWIHFHEKKVRTHAGAEFTFGVTDFTHPCVLVVATDSLGRFYLQKSYRHTLDKDMWEVPAGFTHGRDPLLAAQNELREEAGLACRDWSELGVLWPVSSIGSFPVHVFRARSARPTRSEVEDGELISWRMFAFPREVAAMIGRGELNDPTVIAAIHMAGLVGPIRERSRPSSARVAHPAGPMTSGDGSVVSL